MIKIKKYGWRPSRPDKRDLKFSLPRSMDIKLPAVVDLEPQCPVIYDQLDLGSCTAHAGGGLAQFLMMKLGRKVYRPSMLAIYYWERVLEKTVNEDSGASLRDAIKVMASKGVPADWLMPYEPSKFKVAPAKAVEDFAAQHKIGQYLSLRQNLQDMKYCLATGYPFIFGFSVYDSFESDVVAKTGLMPMPKKKESLLGGHAVMAVGYDDNKKLVKVRNSWGEKWGKKGYFFMPYQFIQDPDLADDFWTSHTIA